MSIDLITKEIVSLFHPYIQEWKAHFAWSEDGTEVIGLTATGRAAIAMLKMNRPQLIHARQMWIKMNDALFDPFSD